MAENLNAKENKEWAGGFRYPEISSKRRFYYCCSYISFISGTFKPILELFNRFKKPIFNICKL
jgi:hypothetical protein